LVCSKLCIDTGKLYIDRSYPVIDLLVVKLLPSGGWKPVMLGGRLTLDIAESRVGFGAVFLAPKRRFILFRWGVADTDSRSVACVMCWSCEMYVRQSNFLYEMANGLKVG
jgi:hypothetical protein